MRFLVTAGKAPVECAAPRPGSDERLRTRLGYDSAEQACAAPFAGGPVVLADSRFDAQMRAEAHAESLASIEIYRIGSGYAVPGEFVIVTGLSQF